MINQQAQKESSGDLLPIEKNLEKLIESTIDINSLAENKLVQFFLNYVAEELGHVYRDSEFIQTSWQDPSDGSAGNVINITAKVLTVLRYLQQASITSMKRTLSEATAYSDEEVHRFVEDLEIKINEKIDENINSLDFI